MPRGVSRGLEHRLERDLERTRHLEGSSQLCLGHLELRPSPVSFLCQCGFLPVRADECLERFRRGGRGDIASSLQVHDRQVPSILEREAAVAGRALQDAASRARYT